MGVPQKRLLIGCVVGTVLLLTANGLVAVRHLGTGAGRTYRWICRESGDELSYNPSVFGGPERAHLAPGGTVRESEWHWELVEPRPRSAWLPWNWLAIWLDPPIPNPDSVIRQEQLGTD